MHRRGGDPAAGGRRHHDVALAIDGHELRGVAASVRGGDRVRLGGSGDRRGGRRRGRARGQHARPAGRQAAHAGAQLERGLLEIDQRAPLRRVLPGEQRRERHVREERIAVAGLAVGVGELGRLDLEVERVGAAGACRAQVEALEQAQLLQEHGALAPGPGLPDARAAVVDPARLLEAARITSQIVGRQQTRVARAASRRRSASPGSARSARRARPGRSGRARRGCRASREPPAARSASISASKKRPSGGLVWRSPSARSGR